jgi:hypothetical protein
MRNRLRRCVQWARANQLAAWLGFFATLALVGLVTVFAMISPTQGTELWMEVGKGLIEILAVVVFGTALKLLTDRYQQQQHDAEETRRALAAKEEQNQRFRQGKYDRLVEATNQLRKVPILIAANRSVKTWSAEMGDVIDASLRLRAIKHEVYSSRRVASPPFRDTAALVYLFEVMYHYTDWVADDFVRRKSELSALQARAEEKQLAEEQVRSRKATVWEEIERLDSVADMRKELSDEKRDECGIELRGLVAPLEGLADAATKPPFPDPSWLVYQTAEGLALELLTGATFAAVVRDDALDDRGER